MCIFSAINTLKFFSFLCSFCGQTISFLLNLFSAWTRCMPGVSMPSIAEPKLWPICVHTRVFGSMHLAVTIHSRRRLTWGYELHLSIKLVWNIRISLKFTQSWVFGGCMPVIFFVNSDVFLQCVLLSEANREYIALCYFCYLWCVACTSRFVFQ